MGQILTKFSEEMLKDQFVQVLGADLPLQWPPKKLLKVTNRTTFMAGIGRGSVHCNSFQGIDGTVLL